MSLESEVQKLTVAANEQTAASQALAQYVSEKMVEIDAEVDLAIQRTDQAIADVEASVPTAVYDTLDTVLWLDINNSDSPDNDGSTEAKAFNSLAAALDAAAKFGYTLIKMASGANIYPLDFQYGLKNKRVVIQLNGNSIEQKIYAPGKAGGITLGGDSEIWFSGSGGTTSDRLITALKDSNVGAGTVDTSFFRRTSDTSRIHVASMEIELGDMPFLGTGNGATGLNELAISHSNIHLRAGVTSPLLVFLAQSSLMLGFVSSTLPAGKTLAELVAGIAYAADGEPRNIISNADLRNV